MDKDLPLESHLEELRRRLLVCLIPLLALLIPLFAVTPYVLPYIFTPVVKWGYSINFYSITDGLVLRIRLALLLDISLILPLILTEAILFIWPGLWARERRAILSFTGLTGALFCAGVAVFILVLTPWLVALWQARGMTVGTIISGARYYTIWQTATLIFGLVCCLPVLAVLGLKLRKALKEDSSDETP